MIRLIPLLCLSLCACQYNSVIHKSSQGALTQNTNVSFLTRSHNRIQTQTGSPNPLPPSEPVLGPNTASNTTGLEGILNAQALSRSYPINEIQSTTDNQGKTAHDFFVYDLDSDSEPAIRAIRIGTAGAVAGQIVK